MRDALKTILEIQEYDMQMVQLMRLKKERQDELNHICAAKEDLKKRVLLKENELIELRKVIRLMEGEVEDLSSRRKALEAQQNQVKKVDEFNALNQEISSLERERVAKEQKLSDLYDQAAAEEDELKEVQTHLDTTTESSLVLEEEIFEAIENINKEGQAIQVERNALVQTADSAVFAIYEKLLRNKKDRVVVPLENRCCSGCHILLTPQHENLVRKKLKHLVFCEHCSRILYWQEEAALEEEKPKTRRRRRATK